MLLKVRNVNAALNIVMRELSTDIPREYRKWRKVSPRGMETLEWEGVFVTEFERPWERVLFSAARDANPFFHFFESLWILAGREDVEFLAQFNSKMRDYSDDGITFHAPYGQRLRSAFGMDQIDAAIDMLKKDKATRQVVLQIWNALSDLDIQSKDIPCNDIIFLKVRDDKLNITVCCRSNDILWGAYGANAVQFSTLQEFIASAVGVGIGTYTQISDSFHVYTDNDAYKRLLEKPYSHDTYENTAMENGVYPLMDNDDHKQWLRQLEYFIEDPVHVEDNPDLYDPFFVEVALPLWEGWTAYKARDYDRALKTLEKCKAYDWSTACQQWVMRRIAQRAVV